ncbi:MAG: hypothetical protein LW823_08220 [Rickettsiales bacterium]|jgi:hypothetical protein|nr:hypothetical protein [Rickettsiales bacterium]
MFFRRPPLMNQDPRDPRFNIFYMLTGGVTFVAFATSFGPCLFSIDSIPACIENAHQWVDVLKGVGDHLIAWGTAFVKAAFAA